LAVEGDRVRAGNTVWKVVVRAGQIPAEGNWTGDRRGSGWGARGSRDFASIGTSLPADASQPVSGASPATSGDGLELTSSDGQRRLLHPNSSLTIGRTTLADWCFADDMEMSSCH